MAARTLQHSTTILVSSEVADAIDDLDELDSRLPAVVADALKPCNRPAAPGAGHPAALAATHSRSIGESRRYASRARSARLAAP